MPEKVNILSRRTVQAAAGPGIIRPMISVTYAAENMMPRVVYLDALKDSPEELRRVIAEDLRLAREGTVETLDLP